MPYNGNLGYLFYKDYYKRSGNNYFDPRKFPKEETVMVGNKRVKKNEIISERNEQLFTLKNTPITDYSPPKNLMNSLMSGNFPCYTSFRLKTTYPGLLTGSGYNHETGSKGEFKLGFFFDHTTGLPLLPGSSVKGVLRSVFPSYHLNDDKKNHQDVRASFIWRLLNNISDQYYIASESERLLVFKLELIVFEGVNIAETLTNVQQNNEFRYLKNKKNWKYLSIYERDVFNDAIIAGLGKDNKLFGEDFITPHINRAHPEMSPFTNPTPLQFLKIIPKVIFEFQFRLHANQLGIFNISSDQKLELYKQILLMIGIGAKTNVGYGQFEPA